MTEKQNIALVLLKYYPKHLCKITPDFTLIWDENNILENPSMADVALNVLRYDRDILIAETDWWANSDLTMTAEQTAYRKALRDLPATESPELDSVGNLTGVIWPTKPQ